MRSARSGSRSWRKRWESDDLYSLSSTATLAEFGATDHGNPGAALAQLGYSAPVWKIVATSSFREKVMSVKKILGMMVPLALAGCGGNSGTENAAAADQGRFISLNAAGDSFAFIMPANMTLDDIRTVSRQHCEGKAACSIRGWEDESQAPSDTNYTSDQYRTSLFLYRVAPGSDQGEYLATNCTRFPQEDRTNCFG